MIYILTSKCIKNKEIWQHSSLNILTCRLLWAIRITLNNCTRVAVTSWHFCSTFWVKKKYGQESTQNHEVSLMIFIENQTIAFFTLIMKTFTMVYLESKCFYQSKATSEIIFVGLWYVKFRHFGQKPLFIFLQIIQ